MKNKNNKEFINCQFCGVEVLKIGGNGRVRRFCGKKCSNKNAKREQKRRNQQRRIDAGFINCKICCKKVEALNSQGHKRIYCSAKCKSDAKVQRLKAEAEERRKEVIQCDFCGKETSKYNPVKGTPKRFCNKQCGREFDWAERKKKRELLYNQKIASILCKYCGMPLKNLKNRSRRSKEYCSRECSIKFHTLFRRAPLLKPIHTFTDNDWISLKNRFNNSCAYCSSNLPLSLDHIIPVAKGGNHSIGNFLPACLRCNSSKCNKTIAEWKLFLKQKGIKVNSTLPFINLSERHLVFPNSSEDYLFIKKKLFEDLKRKPWLFDEEIFVFYGLTAEEQELMKDSIKPWKDKLSLTADGLY